jgi:ribulose-5-phosphate 4-epimerase/fuculose-1-phosphate aldolase
VGTRDVAAFRAAGRTLFSLGLIKGSEGNLSVSDGETLVITRTGSQLSALEEDDVLEGTLDAPPVGASSDLDVHLRWYRERGPGAIAHAHPPGTVPEGPPGAGEHGAYTFAATLQDAVTEIVEAVRRR